ncbi:MAG: ImmA/IrrE family metallo-endopeptidase [Methanobrevibacter sp.]|nr:ImmA/IrrE family metallo-endopeptidase [Methanobrevibacter sp.]
MVSAEIILKSEALRRLWGIDNISPLNILSGAMENIENLTILWFPMLDELSGCCAKTDNDNIICINSKHSKGRQNFTIAHELYHLVYEDEKTSFVCNFNSNVKSEILANQFASSLLIPSIALNEFASRNNIEKWQLDDVIKCEQYFQISHTAMLCKLRREKLITFDEFKDLKKHVKRHAWQLGYDLELYEPTRKYYALGKIIPLASELYNENIITGGKFDEILMDVFRQDLVYNTLEEDEDIV